MLCRQFARLLQRRLGTTCMPIVKKGTRERPAALPSIRPIPAARDVVLDDIDAVIDALEQFSLGGDLADQLIRARAASAGALPVLSFDRRCSGCEGVALPGPG
ncbi:MAG: hypothetical protein KFB97_15180 [Cyanobium sp. M30B3]|nr:MAG: hypothetical protein KFB97_15180 [Cyanobium sp. M30B3]